MAKLNKSLVTLARQAGGSFKTVSDRMKIADRLAERLLKMNIQIRDANHLKQTILRGILIAVWLRISPRELYRMKWPPYEHCYVWPEKPLWQIQLTKN